MGTPRTLQSSVHKLSSASEEGSFAIYFFLVYYLNPLGCRLFAYPTQASIQAATKHERESDLSIFNQHSDRYDRIDMATITALYLAS